MKHIQRFRKIDEMEFGLEASIKTMAVFEEYLGVSYSLAKFDQVMSLMYNNCMKHHPIVNMAMETIFCCLTRSSYRRSNGSTHDRKRYFRHLDGHCRKDFPLYRLFVNMIIRELLVLPSKDTYQLQITLLMILLGGYRLTLQPNLE